MKTKWITKASTVVLWVSMIITGVIFGGFYYMYNRHEIASPGAILSWSYVILIVSTLTTFLFSIVQTIAGWKANRKSAISSAVWIIVLLLIMGGSYLLGKGEPLSMLGYEGEENTYFWLKIADMWIYSLLVLLSLTIVAMLVGIGWSYIKRTR